MIPQRIKDSIDRYVKDRMRPGSFVTAVLENNLTEAFGRADAENTMCLKDIVGYCYNEIPFKCWGSKEKVKAWLNDVQETEATI